VWWQNLNQHVWTKITKIKIVCLFQMILPNYHSLIANSSSVLRYFWGFLGLFRVYVSRVELSKWAGPKVRIKRRAWAEKLEPEFFQGFLARPVTRLGQPVKNSSGLFFCVWSLCVTCWHKIATPSMNQWYWHSENIRCK